MLHIVFMSTEHNHHYRSEPLPEKIYIDYPYHTILHV